jgi:hypothetical protein
MPKPPLPKDVKRLWAAMCDKVSEKGGWVVSMPNAAEVRMECRVDSDLPETLAGLGYELHSGGSTERLLPVGSGVAPVTVAIYAFTMPQLVTRKTPKTITFPAS